MNRYSSGPFLKLPEVDATSAAYAPAEEAPKFGAEEAAEAVIRTLSPAARNEIVAVMNRHGRNRKSRRATACIVRRDLKKQARKLAREA